jgi:hypothetical protein
VKDIDSEDQGVPYYVEFCDGYQAWFAPEELDADGSDSATLENSPRAELLDEAKGLITGDRNNSYGPPTQDFQRTADLWTALGFTFNEGPIEPHHIAMAMILLKMSRATWSPHHRDNWADSAGYSATGFEAWLLSNDEHTS